SNWELAQMTKWGMPGVYTHAFMDGWSPGYLVSVAYNHNGMMRMYETQSGRENTPGGGASTAAARDSSSTAAGGAGGANGASGLNGGRGAGRGGRGARGGGRGGSAPGDSTAGGANPFAGGGGGGGAGRGGRGPTIPTGKGGGQPREWYRGIPIPPNAVQNFSRRNNTNYMETGVLSALQLTSMFPNVILQNFYVKTRNSLNAGSTEAPYGYVVPVEHDMTRAAT